MNRTYILAAIVVALLLAVFLLNRADGDSERGTHLVEGRNFAIEDARDIGRIYIVDRDGNQTDLRRSGDHWLLDEKYRTSENTIKNLLDAVTRIELQTIPSYGGTRTLVENIAANGIRVQIFDRSENKMRGYYIGGATPNELGTYVIMEEAEQPYIAHIPGWDGNMRFRFNLVGDDWRTKKYFQIEADDIQTVTVEYPTERIKSFHLERADGGFLLSPFYNNTSLPTRPIAKGQAEQYLVRLPTLYLNRYRNDQGEERAEFMQQLPFATISVTKIDGESEVLKLYPNFHQRKISVDQKTGELIDEAPLAGYFALINNDEDWVLFNQLNIEPLLLGYDSF